LGHETYSNKFHDYFHRFHERPRDFIPQCDKDLENFQNSQPITDHPTDWGTIHDVEWTESQKFPHVADRLGYPIMKQGVTESIFGVEYAPCHPGYQFQPFVQTPSMDPDPTLNFDIGETIYENRKVLEWIRLYKVIMSTTFMAFPAAYGLEFYKGEGAPSLRWLSENFMWW
jgi:hypothetical protein